MNIISVKYLALIALITIIHSVQAADLGNMEINSGINQKLNADIPLNLAPNESTAGTHVKILSSKINNNGLDNSPEIAINSDDGILKLTTKEVIHAQHIEIILEVKNNKETQYKQFSIDLSRANKGSPLIVSPKNSLEKPQAPTVTTKSYRKKAQTISTVPAHSKKPATIKTENLQQIIDRPNNANLSQPITVKSAPIPVEPSITTDTQQQSASPFTKVESEQSTDLIPPKAVSPIKQQDWITENIFNLIAFLAGISGVLILQKLLSTKSKKPKLDSKRRQLSNHDKYQALQDSSGLESEKSETVVKSKINGDFALFEELLNTRMQQLQEINSQQSQSSTSAIKQAIESIDEDEFGFDFDLPEFAVEYS